MQVGTAFISREMHTGHARCLQTFLPVFSGAFQLVKETRGVMATSDLRHGQRPCFFCFSFSSIIRRFLANSFPSSEKGM